MRPEFGGGRTCEECKKWLYDSDGKIMTRGRRGTIELQQVPNTSGITPCNDAKTGRCPKIPTDAPQATSHYAVEPSDRSYRAWRHYRECRAVGIWPNDPIVRRNAAIIRGIYDQYERMPLVQLTTLMRVLLTQAPGR